MEEKKTIKPDYIFETSWEVCNKIGGIYTVISTKVPVLQREFGNNCIFIGPDTWNETSENPNFTEDNSIFRSWRENAEQQGLKIKVGRWNIEGNPIAILVNFTNYFADKDKILADYWETYKLDSITGSWDYVEPVLFGYASAKVIESFYNFNISSQDKVVAQFHEWMTGSGVLYLKKNIPQVATVFTTHATVVGRCIAGNNMPLYNHLHEYNVAEIAQRFNVMAKHSLESISAKECDVFTTVSEITALECRHFLARTPDVITPNGIDDSFFYNQEQLKHKRLIAREKLRAVASAVTCSQIANNAVYIVNSGRYEYHNKGIDLFLESLINLANDNRVTQQVVAFIEIPANNSGVIPAVYNRVQTNDLSNNENCNRNFLTHGLFEPDYDTILNKLNSNPQINTPDCNVKIIYVPTYLNGDDGIFNMKYYDLLPGFDLAIFPSYYEPWGYTPMESMVFGVCTITSSLAGFGKWAQDNMRDHKLPYILERNDGNDAEVIKDIENIIINFVNTSENERYALSLDGVEFLKQAVWNKFITYYYQAYSQAIDKAIERIALYKDKRPLINQLTIKATINTKPAWRKIQVKHSFPEELKGLVTLSRNLYWCWNSEVIDLFQSLNPVLWTAVDHNPIVLLNSLTYNDLNELKKDKDFVRRLNVAVENFNAYMAEKANNAKPTVAYFSMEFALHESIQIYSGGLGVLAGDYLKEASDSNVDMIGVGILYRYGYFQQSLSPSGDQISQYNAQNFNNLPVNAVNDSDGNPIIIKVALSGRNLHAKVWRIDVGRVPLYLLDADIPENEESERFVTHQLYGGDLENRFKQELLLGVGGIRLLNEIGIKPDLYHCNEGHAAFIGIERMRIFVQEQQFSFPQALELVRASTLFTTHTPVPAGHDAFPEDLLRMYIPHYPQRLNISWNEFMNFGRYHEDIQDNKFSMSVLAAKLSQEMNGVSRIHGRVSRQMFKDMYTGFYENEIHIGYVTNGVHYPTWTNQYWKELYNQQFGINLHTQQSNVEVWQKIQNVPNEIIWNIRQKLRENLINYIKKRLTDSMGTRFETPKHIIEVSEVLNPDALTIGFARRFATYKRAHLLFSNLEKLAAIVNNPQYPVQFVFAGKAHPADKAGSDLIKRIIEVSRMPQFTGKIIFLENYNMAMARKLVQGVDIWLNTPARPLEASGTSGEKAIMNGVVNLSVLDGWWAEGYKPNAGWALKEEVTYKDNYFQDELDAETIYNFIEDEIIPRFYKRDDNNVPNEWVSYIKNTISEIAPHYTMYRQLHDYRDKYYNKMYERMQKLTTNDFALTRELASWKYRVIRAWNDLEIVSLNYTNPTNDLLHLGDIFKAEIVLNAGSEINPENIMVEMISGEKSNATGEIKEPEFILPLKLNKVENGLAYYSLEFPIDTAGDFDFAFRITPYHSALPHRQDFNLVKWA